MEHPLADADGRVIDSCCAGDGLPSPAMFGLSTNLMGVFEIASGDARKAELPGYRLLRVEVIRTSCRL